MKKILFLLFLLLIPIATSCQGTSKEADVASFGPVKVGYLALMGDSPVYLAIDKGYFEEEGLQIEMIRFNSSSNMMPLFTTGDLDIGTGQAGTELFNAIDQGLSVKVVASSSREVEGHEFLPYLVRKDLFDSGEITKPADFKGAKIAINVERGMNEFLWAGFLAQAGLTLEDVEIITLPFPDMNTALANKAIDAAAIPEPLASLAIRDGDAVKISTVSQVFNSPSSGFIFFGKRLLEPENKEIGIRFFKAYMRAARELYSEDGYMDENVEIISKYTNVPAPMIKAGVKNYYDPNGKMTDTFLMDSMMYFYNQGYTDLSQPLDQNQLVDFSFMDEAVSRLGRYED